MVSTGASAVMMNRPTHHEPKRSSSDNRRSNKPIMEKRRRARINNCLNDLKSMLLDSTKKDPARHAKLEKADILEKTVRYVQDLQRQNVAILVAADPKQVNTFLSGFNEALREVERFPGVEPVSKRRLLLHLTNFLSMTNSNNNEVNGLDAYTPHMFQSNGTASSSSVQHQHVLPNSPPGSPESSQSQSNHSTHVTFQMAKSNSASAYPSASFFGYPVHQQQQQHQQQMPSLVPIPMRTPMCSNSANSSSASSSPLTVVNAPQQQRHYSPLSPCNSYESQHSATLRVDDEDEDEDVDGDDCDIDDEHDDDEDVSDDEHSEGEEELELTAGAGKRPASVDDDEDDVDVYSVGPAAQRRRLNCGGVASSLYSSGGSSASSMCSSQAISPVQINMLAEDDQRSSCSSSSLAPLSLVVKRPMESAGDENVAPTAASTWRPW